jgi:hypothetical protein
MLSMTGVVWLVWLGVGMTLTIMEMDEYILLPPDVPFRDGLIAFLMTVTWLPSLTQSSRIPKCAWTGSRDS